MLYILSQVVGWRKNMIIEEWRPIEETNGRFLVSSLGRVKRALGNKGFCGSITNCCKGRNKTAQGFVWRYAEC